MRLDRVIEILLGLVVVGSVLALGAVHPEVMAVVAASSFLAFALALWLGPSSARALRWRSPALVLAALSGCCLLQLVPLELGTLGAIAPATEDIWARALMPLGEPPLTSAPLSLDPKATWIEVLRWSSYAALFVVASTVASRRGAQWGVALVFGAALTAALTTVAHGLAGASRVFGVYEPSFVPAPWHVGPLLNPNNLAGYLNLGALCGMGLLLMRKPVAPRWLVGVGVAVLVGVDVVAASRGGVVFLLAGVLAFGATVAWIVRRSGHSVETARRARWVMGFAVVFGVLLAVLGGTDPIWAELYSDNLRKIELVLWVKPMVADFPWWGVGRGAFESAFPAYQPGQGSVVFTHAENFVAQWAAEWGVPVAALALVALGWHFRPRPLGVGRSVLSAGAWIGVLVLLLQNLVDLGLEVPGVCIGAVVALGSVWGDRKRVVAPDPPSRSVRATAMWTVGVVALGALLIAAAGQGGWRDLGSDRKWVRQELLREKPPRGPERVRELRQQIRAAMLRHPAEPYFPLAGAYLAWQERDQSAMPWLQRALERSLVNGKAHLLLARVLVDRGAKRQGLMELRLAVEADPTLVGDAAELGARWAETREELWIAVPAGEPGGAMLDRLGGALTQRGRRELGAACDRTALERAPGLVGPRVRLASDLVEALSSAEGCPERPSCLARFEAHLGRIRAVEPKRSTADRLRARLLVATGRADEAEKLLAAACERVDDYRACQWDRVAAAAELPDAERIDAAARALLSASCVDRKQCAATATWLGDLRRNRGEWATALGSYERAVREEPTDERLLRLAAAASKLGLHAKAVDALERVLERRGGADPELRARLEAERERLLEGSLR